MASIPQDSGLAPELRERLRRPVSGWRWAWETLIRISLASCASLSLFITLAILALLVYRTGLFFEDSEYREQRQIALQQAAAAFLAVPDMSYPWSMVGVMAPWQLRDLPALERPPVTLHYFLTGTEWSGGFRGEKYGVLPLLTGTLMVTIIAAVLALPTGVLTAIFLSEYAGPRVRALLKPVLEILAGIPTVVYGYFALTTITPLLQQWVPGVQPNNQLSGGIVVAIMILPMVTSLSEDSLRAVPRALRDASYALGANRFETATRVVLPAALSGVTASFLLAIARAMGETMAVSLACGGLPRLSFDPRVGAATITSYIANVAVGDVMHSGTQFLGLFALALVLFLTTLLINLLGVFILRKYRHVYG
ncbi:MAG: phosphate ABC transporter permease subunit PstC [Gemmatales bacterium]|nr:phosphate ABC transporter permease subunit PstC [Gemmatales bacterium]MCS7159070.1 phosphate ABC transporter permease subunit PstC [Gemmatales bacterium]MDW8174270.1 phosphate ABC transporter permease subunit PstC [Gemmatales bacterium]MDW8223276.1 phosphate ABC transporter permease subunit PstC [Gemmatales bacterium]